MAEPQGSDVMVKRFTSVAEHRLLVVGGRVVAAARVETICVTGDGQNTVRPRVEVPTEH
jgi:cyanophycin synthetase